MRMKIALHEIVYSGNCFFILYLEYIKTGYCYCTLSYFHTRCLTGIHISCLVLCSMSIFSNHSKCPQYMFLWSKLEASRAGTMNVEMKYMDNYVSLCITIQTLHCNSNCNNVHHFFISKNNYETIIGPV